MIYCWDWISSAVPRLKTELFREMRHGWDYILHRGGIVVEETAYSPEYDGNQRFGIFHNPIAAKFNSTNEECQYLNNDKISGMITCTRNTPITLKILIKLQLIVISFLRR